MLEKILLKLENMDVEITTGGSLWIKNKDEYISIEKLLVEAIGDYKGKVTINISIEEVPSGIKIEKIKNREGEIV
ncbi:MAG: hypothetical protein AB2462_08965 [Thermoanaerobacter sp.]|jgi:argininosuccinate lyase|uniref:hypothetical protein n=1 Tax=Thermoanaerobacter sp. TaxID=1755 RepID=UPI003463CF96